MFSGVLPPVGPAEAPQPSGDTTIVGTGLLHQLSAAHSCNLSSDRTQHPWFPCIPNVTRWIPSRRRMAWRVPFRQSYSDRRATAGSTRAARRAGITHAVRATAANRRAIAPKVTGSVAETP